MSILYSNLCANITGAGFKSAVFAFIIGSNIGAFLTPTGALAVIMFTNLVNEHDTKYTFVNFVKYGAIISIPIILTALLMISLTVTIN